MWAIFKTIEYCGVLGGKVQELRHRRPQVRTKIPDLFKCMGILKACLCEWKDLPESTFSFSFPALLVVETETFGSHIRIKGKESEHYICMNEKGKIVGRVSVFLVFILGIL